MLVIRLFRIGKKNQSSFKIVVTDKRNPPRGGRFVEQVGVYNPLTKEKVLQKERIQYWLSKGAQPSSTVHNLLVKNGILEGKKIPVHKKSKKQEEKPAIEEIKEVEPLSSKPPKEEMKEVESSLSSSAPEGKMSEVSPQPDKTEEPKKEEGL